MKTARRLRKLRRHCERQSGARAADLELPLSHILHDVCQALRLPPKKRRRVLGRRAWVALEDIRETRVELARPQA